MNAITNTNDIVKGAIKLHRDAKKLLSDAKFYEGYARYITEEGRYETWDEAVDRVMAMHTDFYKDKLPPSPPGVGETTLYTPELKLAAMIEEARQAYKAKLVLGAQRALQFGGEQLIKHMMRMYNCTSSYADRPAFFGEAFYILLCGAGVGFFALALIAPIYSIGERI